MIEGLRHTISDNSNSRLNDIINALWCPSHHYLARASLVLSIIPRPYVNLRPFDVPCYQDLAIGSSLRGNFFQSQQCKLPITVSEPHAISIIFKSQIEEKFAVHLVHSSSDVLKQLLDTVFCGVGIGIEEDVLESYCVRLLSESELVYYIELVMVFDDRLLGSAEGFPFRLLLLNVICKLAQSLEQLPSASMLVPGEGKGRVIQIPLCAAHAGSGPLFEA